MLNTITANLNSDGRLGASYELTEPLCSISVDTPMFQKVRIRNTGRITWSFPRDHAINLSYHWQDTRGQIVDFEGVRTQLGVDLEPGAAVVVEMHVEPPDQPGEYQLVIDLVEEDVGWFSIQGVPPLVVPITVQPAPRDVLRACVLGPICLIHDAVGNQMRGQLRVLQERGYQTLMITEHLDVRHSREERLHMVAVPYAELVNGVPSAYSRRALRFFRNADLYIFHFPVPYQLFNAITAVERGVVVVDYHGVTPPKLWDGPGHEQFMQMTRQQLALLHYADYAIAHSAFTRGEVIATGVIASERVYQMPYIVPLERFRPGARSPELLARYNLSPDQPILLYVGRTATNKRIEDLVRALALVRQREPRAVLLIVGDNRSGAYALVAERSRVLAEQLGVAEALIFTGQVPDAELPDHYRLGDVFVVASIHEGFCIPAIEAMACGVPVVGAHATALPETIGAAGLTFRPEDPADLAAKVLLILESRWQADRQPATVP